MLLAIGEATWAEKIGIGHFARMRRVRELLIRSGQSGAEAAGLLLFGGTEPSPQLRAAAANGDVKFIGLNELY